MPTIQLRRGPSADLAAATAADGEPLFTTDTHQLYIGYSGAKYLIGTGGGGGGCSPTWCADGQTILSQSPAGEGLSPWVFSAVPMDGTERSYLLAAATLAVPAAVANPVVRAGLRVVANRNTPASYTPLSGTTLDYAGMVVTARLVQVDATGTFVAAASDRVPVCRGQAFHVSRPGVMVSVGDVSQLTPTIAVSSSASPQTYTGSTGDMVVYLPPASGSGSTRYYCWQLFVVGSTAGSWTPDVEVLGVGTGPTYLTLDAVCPATSCGSGGSGSGSGGGGPDGHICGGYLTGRIPTITIPDGVNAGHYTGGAWYGLYNTGIFQWDETDVAATLPDGSKLSVLAYTYNGAVVPGSIILFQNQVGGSQAHGSLVACGPPCELSFPGALFGATGNIVVVT